MRHRASPFAIRLFQDQALESATALSALGDVSAIREPVGQRLYASRLHAAFVTPLLPGSVELSAGSEGKWPTVCGAVFQPFSENVLIIEVAFRGFGHEVWRRQSDSSPFSATIEAPAQNCRPFALELFRQVGIALFRRNLNDERNQ